MSHDLNVQRMNNVNDLLDRVKKELSLVKSSPDIADGKYADLYVQCEQLHSFVDEARDQADALLLDYMGTFGMFDDDTPTDNA